MIFKNYLLAFILLCGNCSRAAAQSDSLRMRQRVLNVGLPVAYGASMTGLYYLWYSDYPMGKFHFFNDNNEWLQVDKAGHVFSAYQLSRTGIQLYQWAGLPAKKAALRGGLAGYGYLTTIEILDGFSKNWGASWGDLAANTLGTGLCLGQELAWHEQKISLKYSFRQSAYHSIRPNLLGENFPQQFFKDYNGHSYWLSANIKSICLPKTSKFPAWLNLAVGYGADGMVGAEKNSFANPLPRDYSYIPRMRQWYLAPDIDFTRIPTQSKTLRSIFFILNCVKLPSPALEKNKNGFKFHYLYF